MTSETNGMHRRGRSAWLFILPGSTLLGMAVGLFVRQPGFGLLAGMGAGALLWGLIVAFRR